MRASLLFLALVLAAGLVFPAHAQEITYTKESTVQMGGSLGDLMRLVPGGDGKKEERVMISVPAKTVRTDEEDQSTIVNFGTGDMWSINHEDEWWMHMNFGDMMNMAGAMGNPSGNMPPGYQPPPSEEPEVEYEAQISVEETGQTREVLGYQTRQIIMRVDLIPVRAPEGQSLEDMPTHVIVTSMWVADDFPGNEAMKALSEELGQQFFEQRGDGFAAAFAQNSALAQAFQENAEELAKMDAMPLEQTIAFSTLTGGMEFDLNKALDEDLDEGGGPSLLGAARSGLESAARGRLGGLMNRGRQPEPEPEMDETQPAQLVIMRLHERVVSFEESQFEAGWDQLPEGYQERQSPFQRRN